MVARQRLPPALVARAERARERLHELRGLPFLAGVPPLTDYRGPTPRIQRDPDYRAVYRVWQLLRRRPLLTWDEATLHIPVADLPRLYERWCAACVALALLELPGYTLSAQTILVDGDDEQLLALPDEVPLVTLGGPDGVGLALRYHPRYRPGVQSAPLQSLDRHTRIPDLVIELTRPDEPPTVVVLDAKYRLDASGGVPESALADAYSYLGAIGTPASGRATVAAALLYPGHGPAEVYASGVAALPLLPGAEGALHAWLAGLVARGWRG
jgi:large subunit ribosomal protein MRP49